MARFTTTGGSGDGTPGAPGQDGSDGLDSRFLGTWDSVTYFLSVYQGGPVGLEPGDWWAFVKDNENPNKVYIVREDPNSATGWVIDDNEHFILPAGADGADGADGAQGPQGDPGPMPFNYQGEFDYGVTYAGNDAVTFQGGLWKLNNFIGAAGYAPTPGQWTLIIPAGTAGADGADGADGSDGDPGADGAQGSQGEPGSPGLVYLGNYVSGNGYIANLAVVKGSDNNLYIATSNGGLGDPVGNSAEWDIFIPKGEDGSNGTGFTFRGAWNDTDYFNINDVVTFNGECYVAIQSSVVVYPNETTHWTKIAEKGADANTADFTFTESTMSTNGDMDISVLGVPGEINLSAYSGINIQTHADFGLTANKIITTNNGAIDNIAIGDDVLIGDGNVANHLVIVGYQDPTNGGIVLGNNKTEQVSSDGSNLNLGADNDIILYPGSSYAYLGTPTIGGETRIATIGDVAAARFGASASYYSTVDQGPQTSVNTVQAFTYNNNDWQTGVLLQNSSQIKMLSAGKYNIAFSAQLFQISNTGTVNIWLTKNGTVMANTNTKIVVESNAPYKVAAWNFFVEAAADDYYELVWSSSSTNTKIEYDAAQTINGNVHPAIPSIILTVNQVG
jgi:hypothetical protein